MRHRLKKTALFAGILGTCVLFLTSCQVNWFGGTREVAWYWIAIPVALVSVAGYLLIMSGTYECPHCETRFRPRPYQLSALVHCNARRLIKCPTCKKTSFCRRVFRK